jgi:ferritin
MLHWFIDEQVEEEDSVSGILDTLERIGDKDQGLMMLDRELGQRGSD